MKHENLSKALNEIQDIYIIDAIDSRKQRFPRLGLIAAVFAVVIIAGVILTRSPMQTDPQSPVLLHPTNAPEQTDPQPSTVPEVTGSTEPPTEHTSLIDYHLDFLVATPKYPQLCSYPLNNDSAAYSAWQADQQALHNQLDGYADNLHAYFAYLIPTLLTDNGGENTMCSPLNIYMALAMLAETTGGESQQQILTLLQADSINTLRTQAGQVWKAHYNNDGLSTSILGTSLWLHEDATYNESTVNTLADSYYASVFRGRLGTDQTNSALQAWLNEQTGGLLKEQSGNAKLSSNSTLAIATTVLYQVQWQSAFREENNTQATFHGASGNTEETFMNRELTYGPYYWSDNFSAVYLPLEDNSRMWLLLPDEGTAPEYILQEASAFFAQNPYAYDSSYENQKRIIVNLSLPKFDIASDTDLAQKLQKLGVTDIFQSGNADFSPLLTDGDSGCVDQVMHAARVNIDEQGVTASSFTVIDRAGATMPPAEEIDFVLNRPFLFYIESSDGLPLFTGIVNEP